ncbi:MAG: RNA 2'-phosphotransferase [Nitrososphaeraceae archaeon]
MEHGKEMTKLSHIVSYALRHNPLEYNLMLDKEGWTSVDELLNALSLHHNNRWYRHLKRQDLEDMIAGSDKVRFELKDSKIRALYGHSYSSILFTKMHKTASKPPAILYHGTSSSAAKNIMSEGLRPMDRQYVHLSIDKNTAIQVGKRKTDIKRELVIMAVSAMEAYNTGAHHFYRATDLVWLTDYIHPNFMELLK